MNFLVQTMHDYFRNTYGTFAMLVVVSHPLLIEVFFMYDFSKSGTAIFRNGGEFRRLGAALHRFLSGEGPATPEEVGERRARSRAICHKRQYV